MALPRPPYLLLITPFATTPTPLSLSLIFLPPLPRSHHPAPFSFIALLCHHSHANLIMSWILARPSRHQTHYIHTPSFAFSFIYHTHALLIHSIRSTRTPVHRHSPLPPVLIFQRTPFRLYSHLHTLFSGFRLLLALSGQRDLRLHTHQPRRFIQRLKGNSIP